MHAPAAGWLATAACALALAGGCASGTGGSAAGGAAVAPSVSQPAPVTHARRHHRAVRRARHRRRSTRRRHVAGVPAIDMPNPALTPGVALTTNAARVCVRGYSASVRDVPQSEKAAVYARYGVADVPYKHEVDHLVSLEIGGSNAIANLWPEPYAGRWGARTKDVLEDRLRPHERNQEPGPRVGQQRGEPADPHHRGHRDRHRADPQRGQEQRDELRRVGHEHQQPLLGPQAGPAQAARGPADPVVQLGVGQLAPHAGEGEPLAVAVIQVPVEQVGTGVERRHQAPSCGR